FGYDQLRAGLEQTATSLQASPALLCLSWEDIHPALSWRSRATLGAISVDEIERCATQLEQELIIWLTARGMAETYLVLPPAAWLPLHDACTPFALGSIGVAASGVAWALARGLVGRGIRLLRTPVTQLNYRDLLQAGCPLSVEDSRALATLFVDTAFTLLRRKKVIVTDLDGTLWAGVIGEEGAGEILCRPEGKGYPHYIFQKFLAKLKREGIWLAWCSKNNPEDALAAFEALEMPLRLEDFAAWRCNWESKAANIRSIAEELNIRSEDMVVIDDNPAELAQLQHQLPGLVCLQTPREGQGWLRLFHELQQLCGAWRISEEDRLRSDGAVRRARLPSASSVHTADGAPAALEHLRELRLDIRLNRQAAMDPRSLELINKTNQFTLTGERLSAEDWLRWVETRGVFCISVRLRDRFGDFGTIGVVTGRKQDETLVRLKQLVVSCRAFGRGVELVILGELLHWGAWDWLQGPYVDTGKNVPARRFLASLGCQMEPGGEWQVSRRAVEEALTKVLLETEASVTRDER
ncbi:MAG: HAD-IIIC family phosphatase, partial [Candidatus Omnitrophota bacterium]|nr:HAD-IIIC family phosphatase [Candidatus Omnitrophota bacterium]